MTCTTRWLRARSRGATKPPGSVPLDWAEAIRDAHLEYLGYEIASLAGFGRFSAPAGAE